MAESVTSVSDKQEVTSLIPARSVSDSILAYITAYIIIKNQISLLYIVLIKLYVIQAAPVRGTLDKSLTSPSHERVWQHCSGYIEEYISEQELFTVFSLSLKLSLKLQIITSLGLYLVL